MHTPGALRAARRIMDDRCGTIHVQGGNVNCEELAELIDRETAAPDLLDALQGLINIVTHPASTKEQMRMFAKQARAAIAKARGES